MYFSRSILLLTLAQTEIDEWLRRSLFELFHAASREWRLLEQIQLPADLPATSDPVLLALRRLVRRDLGELRAMHRAATLRAAFRHFGLLELMLEETVLLGQKTCTASGLVLPFVEDPAFRIFFGLLPKSAPARHQPQLYDLRARAMAEVSRRLLAEGVPFDAAMLAFAHTEAEMGSHDLELRAFFAESLALAHEREGAGPRRDGAASPCSCFATTRWSTAPPKRWWTSRIS